MTEREVLKLALEALENVYGKGKRCEAAIAAIKQVLAQPEQEPFGWVVEHKHGGTAVYTSPPQRKWVGLTDEQFLEASRLAEDGNYMVAFQRIQQWLKEKNT